VLELGPLGLGFFGALADGDDLCRGVVLALVPLRPLAGDRLQPAIGEFGIASNRLRFDPYFGKCCAMLGNILIDLGKLGFQIGGGRQRVQSGFRFGAPGGGLVAAGAGSLPRFLERRKRLSALPYEEQKRVRAAAAPFVKILWIGCRKGSEGRSLY